MKLATFIQGSSTPRIGVVEAGAVADLSTVVPQLPTDMRALLEGGSEALNAVRAATDRATRIPLAEIRLLAPVPSPRKFLGLGLSFRSHVAEVRERAPQMTVPPHQVWFNKQVTSIAGPRDPIHLPRISDQLDYEGELGVVIGRRGRHVRKEEAMAYVAGFLVCNDVSVRDWQMRSPTAMLGKSFDTHGPMGPWLTTVDEDFDPTDARIRTWVDDELRQDGRTTEFLYSIPEMIAELTSVFTLEPGDVLSTGSPAGVGALMTPPRFLQAGQTVKVEIDGLGAIENLVIAEPPDTDR